MHLVLMCHFTVLCSVTWPVNAGKAGGDHTLIQTFLLFSFKCEEVSFQITWFTQQKQWGLYQKVTSSSASLPFKGRVIEQTTKYSMEWRGGIRDFNCKLLQHKHDIIACDCWKDTEKIIMLMVCLLLKKPLRQGHQNHNRNHQEEFFLALLQLLLR